MRPVLLSAFALVASSVLVQAQDTHRTLSVGTATATRGTTSYGTITIPAGVDSGTVINLAIVHGAEPGPIVAFVAGSHGTEYTSVVALSEIIARLNPDVMRGSAIIVPLLNVASFEQMTTHLNPIDRKSMNGQYPGDPKGTQTQRVLHAIAREVVDQADIVVDLHGGDLDEDLRPYSYWFRVGDPARDSASKKLALAFGLDHIIVSDLDLTNPASIRSLSGYSLSQGKRSFVAEAGRAGLVLDPDVASLMQGVVNVLAAEEVLPKRKPKPMKVTWLGEDARVRADVGVMFTAMVARNTRVKAGQVVGRTSDYVGRPLPDVLAPQDGLVTFIRAVPSTWKGATLVTVTKIYPAPPAYSKPR